MVVRAALLLFAFMAIASPAIAEDIIGRVVGISDGDTLTLLTSEKRQVKIRLAEIDTPESRQPYGDRARQELSELAFGKDAVAAVQDTDRYGRKVARVRVGSVDVNVEMIRRGAAWVYRQYLRDQSLLAVEEGARAAKVGLWALPEAQRTPPWEWRRVQRGGNADVSNGATGTGALPSSPAPQSPRAASIEFSCGTKRTCGEMTGCAEARFYLEQCGLRRLDGDRDGVPCEKLCR